MIVILNNRDSFVYNLDCYFRELGQITRVVCTHTTSFEAVRQLAPGAIIVSPGPCTPDEAGISCETVRRLSGQVPILGVCLGHQVIGQVFGGQVGSAAAPCYGQASLVEHDGEGLFEDLANPLRVGLYHSLGVTLGENAPLHVQARSPSGDIMAFRHPAHPTFGVQFHPESILSEQGHDLLRNFLTLAGLPSC